VLILIFLSFAWDFAPISGIMVSVLVLRAKRLEQFSPFQLPGLGP